MTWSESDNARQSFVWLAIAGCLVLAGCGRGGENFLARIRGTPAAVVQATPRGSRAMHPGAGLSGIKLAASETAGLNRDPFIGHSLPQAVDSRSDAHHQRNLFERLAASETALARPRPPARPADRLADAPAAESVSIDPRIAFDDLARRERFATSATPGDTSGLHALGAAARTAHAAATLEELAPSPEAAESHLALVVDSAPAPRRIDRRTVPSFNSAPPPLSQIDPDFLAVDVQPRTEVSPPFRSAMLSGPDLQRVTANRGLIAVDDPPPLPPPEFITSTPIDRGPPEVLPELRIDLDEPQPAPSAPEVGGPWGPRTDRALLGGPRQGDQSPRTLPTIEFSDDTGSGGASSLARFRGPLVIVLGLLLVACAAVAMRRQTSEAETGRMAHR